MEKSIGRWTITTKAKGGAEKRNEVHHSDICEIWLFWLVYIVFLGKKQTTVYMYIPEGAGCVGLRASEVEMSPSWDIKHKILTL